MIPSLLTFTLLTALVLLVVGLPLALMPARLESLLRAFPRDRATAIVTMLLGGGWFLWKITRLGQSDFGDYKNLLFILFAATLVGSLLYVKDFLAVRGVAILVLLSANTGLKSAFGLYDVPARLVLVAILYLFILAALMYGTIPYKMRDHIDWACAKPARVRGIGLVFSVMAVLLLAGATQY